MNVDSGNVKLDEDYVERIQRVAPMISNVELAELLNSLSRKSIKLLTI